MIITDSQDKGKNSVFTFINAVTDYIQFEKGDMLIIYTDGPSLEFKNRYIVKLVSMLSKIFQCKVSWKYFATSYGKGVVDGIGGSAKSLVRKSVMNQGKNAVIVQNSADFYKVAKDDIVVVMPQTILPQRNRRCALSAASMWKSEEEKEARGVTCFMEENEISLREVARFDEHKRD